MAWRPPPCQPLDSAPKGRLSNRHRASTHRSIWPCFLKRLNKCVVHSKLGLSSHEKVIRESHKPWNEGRSRVWGPTWQQDCGAMPVGSFRSMNRTLWSTLNIRNSPRRAPGQGRAGRPQGAASSFHPLLPLLSLNTRGISFESTDPLSTKPPSKTSPQRHLWPASRAVSLCSGFQVPMEPATMHSRFWEAVCAHATVSSATDTCKREHEARHVVISHTTPRRGRACQRG